MRTDGRSIGAAAGVQFPGSAGRFCVWISGAHALRLIYRAGKEGSTVSSIICDRWLILFVCCILCSDFRGACFELIDAQ